MDKDMKRAERRSIIKWLKLKRSKFWGWPKEEPMSQRLVGIATDTPKPCNCWMCSKPKKHTLSIAEIREMQPGLQEFDLDSEE